MQQCILSDGPRHKKMDEFGKGSFNGRWWQSGGGVGGGGRRREGHWVREVDENIKKKIEEKIFLKNNNDGSVSRKCGRRRRRRSHSHLAWTNMVSWGKRPASFSVVPASIVRRSRRGKFAISSYLSDAKPLDATYKHSAYVTTIISN